MPYPSRPVLEPLEEFKGSATVRQNPEQRVRLIAFAGSSARRAHPTLIGEEPAIAAAS